MIQYQRLSECAIKHGTRSKGFLGALGWVLRGLLAVLAFVVGIAGWTSPALAASFGWAYLWAHAPASSSYTPSLLYQFNSSGATNTVVRRDVGAYTALLPNLGADAGIVHVTADGAGTEVCKVVSWYPSGSTQQVHVQCFTSAGAPVDTRFTLTYVSHLNLVGSACDYEPGTCSPYAWANQTISPSDTPSLPYQFNRKSCPIRDSSPITLKKGSIYVEEMD